MNPTVATVHAATTDYRSFFERSPALLCTAGFDGAFIEVNEAFARALGFEVGDLLARSVTGVVHPADRDATMQALAAVADGTDVCFDNRCQRRDGSFCWLSWSVRADAEHQLLYCSAKDVTELREHAEVVDKLLAELERSNTDLAQFAYVASHDLSEPLRMVSSCVQLLAARYSGQLDADADEFIGFAVDGAARMKVLIDDLLAYSRAGGSVALRRRVDCAVLVRGALADLDRTIEESSARIVVDELPVVDGDPGQLALVFQNLLANALKFVSDDRPAEIRVRAERAGQAWCFSVEDNGIGVPEAHRERIFMMFKRLHGRNKYPGTGIGLALCHKIIDRLGGRIWLESMPDQGSAFRFTLPDAVFEDVVPHV